MKFQIKEKLSNFVDSIKPFNPEIPQGLENTIRQQTAAKKVAEEIKAEKEKLNK